MTTFAEQNPVQNSFWGEVEDISILSAALLTFNIEPSALDQYLDAIGEPVCLDELPAELLPRIEVLRSAVRAGSLTATERVNDKHGRVDENKTRIEVSDFIDWCNDRGFTHNIPNRQITAPIAAMPHCVNVTLPQSESPFDPLPLSGIAAIFPRANDPEANLDIWKALAKNAKRNGLDMARVGTGSGPRQSNFDPSLVGDWLVSKGKMDRARVDRILRSNLPPRSAHLRDLLAP